MTESSYNKNILRFDCNPYMGTGLMHKVGIALSRAIPPFYVYTGALQRFFSLQSASWARRVLTPGPICHCGAISYGVHVQKAVVAFQEQ